MKVVNIQTNLLKMAANSSKCREMFFCRTESSVYTGTGYYLYKFSKYESLIDFSHVDAMRHYTEDNINTFLQGESSATSATMSPMTYTLDTGKTVRHFTDGETHVFIDTAYLKNLDGNETFKIIPGALYVYDAPGYFRAMIMGIRVSEDYIEKYIK